MRHTGFVQLVVTTRPDLAAADRIAFRLRDAVRRRGSASLGLSGGSTAPALIEALIAETVPWSDVTIWQVDERVAPDGDEQRNANQLVAFDELPCRIRPMPVTAADLRAAARRYAVGLPGRFDVIHLGIGDDGHTASWPPDEPGIRDSERAVEIVSEFHGVPRMTLTRRVVNEARSRVVYAVGASKRPVIERWLLDDRSLPISHVRSAWTSVFLDAAAAPAVPLQ